MNKIAKTWCPRCNQGWVVFATIRCDDTQIWICEECDATWQNNSEVNRTNFIDFSVLMERKGLSGVWTELNVK